MKYNTMSHTNSSCIKSYKYEKQTLVIYFTSGATYAYLNVPENIVVEFVTAPSMGSYFYHNIRDRYVYIEI